MLINSFRSGDFEISVFNSLEKKVIDKWDQMNSTTLKSSYLLFLEESKPEDLFFRYVIIDKVFDNEKKIVAIIYFQHLKFTINNIHLGNSTILNLAARIILFVRPFHFLICGNLFAVNFPAISFNENIISRQQIIDILFLIEKLEKPDVIILKDLDEFFTSESLIEYGWKPYPEDLTMALDIKQEWKTLEDYKHSLTKKYRKRTEKIIESGRQIIKNEFSAYDIKKNEKQIMDLFYQVASRQVVRMGLIGPDYFYDFKNIFPEKFNFMGYYYQNKLIAFTTYVEHGDILEIHYIGIDYNFNKSLSIYFNILIDGIERAIHRKKIQLELGRTAREAKANVGATPVYFNDYFKIKGKLANSLAERLIKYFQNEIGEQWTQRHPFRK